MPNTFLVLLISLVAIIIDLYVLHQRQIDRRERTRWLLAPASPPPPPSEHYPSRWPPPCPVQGLFPKRDPYFSLPCMLPLGHDGKHVYQPITRNWRGDWHIGRGKKESSDA